MQAPGQDQEDQKDQGEDQEADQENQDKKTHGCHLECEYPET